MLRRWTFTTVVFLLAGWVTTPSAFGQSGVFAWGWNDYGQLGNGSNTSSSSPVASSGLGSGADTVGRGFLHSLAVQNGAAFAWGSNTYGQLGIGSNTSTQSPVALTGLTSGITNITGGTYHSLAIQNGAAYAWGYNGYGQLGNGNNSDSNVPVAVTGMTSGVSAVSGGLYHSLAVQNGAAYAWGDNSYGQLGDNTTFNNNLPVAVTGLNSGVSNISAGSNHSLAIMNGAVYSWGRNEYGQLGNGTTIDSSTPLLVPGIAGTVLGVSAGTYHSLALVVDGGLPKVYSWGYNSDGQLGDGTMNDSLSPVLVSGLNMPLFKVAAGQGYSLALTFDFRLYAWGDNSYGQYGNGTNTSSLVPVEVLPPSGYLFTSIEASDFHAVATLTAIAVPEPSTMALTGMVAVAGCGWVGYRRYWTTKSTFCSK